MAHFYILFSEKLNKFYIGSCLDVKVRLEEHRKGIYTNSFTKRSDDWELYYLCSNLAYEQARKIEIHIKKMKSSKYILNLKKYPEIMEKLKVRYK